MLGADHPDTLASRNNLADAYQSAGRLEEAIALLERTLADRERVLGAEHPDTLASRNNLAGAYQSAGRLDEAIPLFERTLADRERVLADHPDTLPSRHNLAGAYQWRGASEAIPLYERTVSRPGAGPGRRPPVKPCTRATSVAYAYRSAGRLEEAIALYEQNLTDRERVLAPSTRHPALAQQTSPTPISRRGASTRRSRCSSRTSPTGSGCWAPITPTPWPPPQPRRRLLGRRALEAATRVRAPSPKRAGARRHLSGA